MDQNFCLQLQPGERKFGDFGPWFIQNLEKNQRPGSWVLAFGEVGSCPCGPERLREDIFCWERLRAKVFYVLALF